MEPTREKIPATDGLSLSLVRWSHEGVALMFLHGFDNDAHVWDDSAPALAPYYQTLALDLRGHGESERDPKARYDHRTMARDVEAVLEQLGVQRVVLVGHSMGGRVAMHYTRRNPTKMAGLVLVDVGPELDTRGVTRIQLEMQTAEPTFASVSEFEDVLAVRYPVTARATLARLARHWLRRRADGRYEPRTDPAFSRRRSDRSPEDARAWLRKETETLWEALRKTPCGTLVIRGAASDVFDPETAERMVEEALPNGRLDVIPRSGHSVMLDNPEGFLASLTGFALGDS